MHLAMQIRNIVANETQVKMGIKYGEVDEYL